MSFKVSPDLGRPSARKLRTENSATVCLTSRIGLRPGRLNVGRALREGAPCKISFTLKIGSALFTVQPPGWTRLGLGQSASSFKSEYQSEAQPSIRLWLYANGTDCLV